MEGDYALQYDNRSVLLKDESLHEGEVYPVLRRAIVELYLQPGATVSIKDICEHYKMGRSPVRDALMRLAQEGLVTLLPQRGTQISPIDLSRVDQERFLRLSVEEEVMKLFVACHTPSDIAPLQEILRQHHELCDKKAVDIRQFLFLDDQFHATFFSVTDKLYCLHAIQTMGGHYRRMRMLTCGANGPESLQEILRQHSALLTALQARDTETMRNVFQFHLRKLDREELIIQKQFPYLFKDGGTRDFGGLLWKDDFLYTLRQVQKA